MTEGKPLNLEIKNQPKLQWPMVFSLRPPGCKIIEGHFCSALRFFIVPIVFQQDLQWQYHLWFYIGHWTKDVKYAKKQFMMLISSKLTVVDENQPILWDGLVCKNAIAGYSFWYNFRSDNGWITVKTQCYTHSAGAFAWQPEFSQIYHYHSEAYNSIAHAATGLRIQFNGSILSSHLIKVHGN